VEFSSDVIRRVAHERLPLGRRRALYSMAVRFTEADGG
jgi:hypothetical protein